jgi:hypothetical protein
MQKARGQDRRTIYISAQVVSLWASGVIIIVRVPCLRPSKGWPFEMSRVAALHHRLCTL